MKTKHKPLTAAEVKCNSDKLEIRWEKFDLKQFRRSLSADLADETDKSVTSCASNHSDLIDRVVRAHLNDASDHATQRLLTEKAKRKQDSKRAITQAEATASFKG
jgi:hypothetical protein